MPRRPAPPPGSWWQGRRLPYDPDVQAAEQAQQQWRDRALAMANERVGSIAELEALAALDPGSEYERHRANWIETGSRIELALMLEWVR